MTLTPYITVTRARAGRLYAIYVSSSVTLGERRSDNRFRGSQIGQIVKAFVNPCADEVAA